MNQTWYKNTVIYAVDVRTFRDSNGHGIGHFLDSAETGTWPSSALPVFGFCRSTRLSGAITSITLRTTSMGWIRIAADSGIKALYYCPITFMKTTMVAEEVELLVLADCLAAMLEGLAANRLSWSNRVIC